MNNFFLTSFPKSGNTWVRFLIGNIYNQLKNEFGEVDFHNIHSIIPEFEPKVKKPYFSDLPHIFKTHELHSTAFNNSVLIVRNPYDALFSYYHYLNGENISEISLPELIFHESYGIHGIVAHTNSYVRKCDNLLIVTYERLLDNTQKELNRICRFLKLEVPEHHLLKAIENSSFSSMRRIEVKKGRKFAKSDFLFTRSGKIGEGVRRIKKLPDIFNYIQKEILRSPILEFLYI